MMVKVAVSLATKLTGKRVLSEATSAVFVVVLGGVTGILFVIVVRIVAVVAVVGRIVVVLVMLTGFVAISLSGRLAGKPAAGAIAVIGGSDFRIADGRVAITVVGGIALEVVLLVTVVAIGVGLVPAVIALTVVVVVAPMVVPTVVVVMLLIVIVVVRIIVRIDERNNARKASVQSPVDPRRAGWTVLEEHADDSQRPRARARAGVVQPVRASRLSGIEESPRTYSPSHG